MKFEKHFTINDETNAIHWKHCIYFYELPSVLLFRRCYQLIIHSIKVSNARGTFIPSDVFFITVKVLILTKKTHYKLQALLAGFIFVANNYVWFTHSERKTLPWHLGNRSFHRSIYSCPSFPCIYSLQERNGRQYHLQQYVYKYKENKIIPAVYATCAGHIWNKDKPFHKNIMFNELNACI
jgi:hypothetical protein